MEAICRTDATQTVLVLDDDESSRFVLRAILERAAITVLDASHAAGAVDICESHPQPICLVVVDVILRGSGGPETVKKLKALRPEMAILFVSGYPLEHLEERGLIEQAIANGEFLQKPFTPQVFLRAVRNLIG